MAWQLQEKFAKESQSKDPQAYGGGGSHPLMFGFPHHQGFSANFFQGIRSLDCPVKWIDAYSTGHPIDLTRNIIASQMLKRHCDYLFFVDSDIILQPDTLTSLMDHKMPILSAVYMSRSPPYKPVALFNKVPLEHEITNTAEMIEVHEVGAGCLLIERRVFERIGKKLNEYHCLRDHSDDRGQQTIIYTDQEARQYNYTCKYCDGIIVASFFKTTLGFDKENPLSEDYYFCLQARKAGYQIFVLSNCVVGHEPRVGDWKIGKDGLQTNLRNASFI